MAQDAPATPITELSTEDIGEFAQMAVDWLSSDGVAFGINLVAALAVFIVGRMVIGLLVRGVRIAMQKNDVAA